MSAFNVIERFMLYCCFIALVAVGIVGYFAATEYGPQVLEAYRKIQFLEQQIEKLQKLRPFREGGECPPCDCDPKVDE